jgi:hypothetical protein
MSLQAMSWVIESSQHKASAFVVLLMIANHANREGENAFPGLGTLADEARIDVRTVKRLIPTLQQSGELVVHTKRGDNHVLGFSLPHVRPWLAELERLKAQARQKSDKLSPSSKPTKVTSDAQKGDISSRKSDIPTPNPRLTQLTQLTQDDSKADSTHQSQNKNARDLLYAASIAAYIEDYSAEFGDVEHRISNVTQALALWTNSGLTEEAMIVLIQQAKQTTRKYQGKHGARGIENKMAYFFTVLRGLVEKETTP